MLYRDHKISHETSVLSKNFSALDLLTQGWLTNNSGDFVQYLLQARQIAG